MSSRPDGPLYDAFAPLTMAVFGPHPRQPNVRREKCDSLRANDTADMGLILQPNLMYRAA